MRGFFRPPKIIWLLAHLIIFLLGILFVYAPGIAKFLGEGLAVGLGAALIASGVAGYILYLYVSLSEDDKQRYAVLVTAGLSRIFPARSVVIKEEYDQRIREAIYIDMIGFGLSTFRQDYGDVFGDWTKKRVRILVLDPNFPQPDKSYAAQRDREERNEDGRIAAEISEFIKMTGPLIKEGRFEVKIMRALPSINYFRLDNEIFWGPYLVGGPSRNTPTLLIAEGYLFNALSSHFEALWSNPEFSAKPQ
jgi:hypothetical protein